VLDVARTAGITNMKYVEDFVEQAMANVRRYHNDLGDSYAMDPSGVVVRVDPETQRQGVSLVTLSRLSEIESTILAATNGRVRAQGAQAA
jgi:hypothetical protein